MHSYLIFHKIKFLLCFLLTGAICSCTSTKSLTYFQQKNNSDTTRYTLLSTIAPPPSKIQTDDILAIVISSLSEESNKLFNVSSANAITTTSFPGVTVGNNNQPLGYLVDPVGEVNLPLIGKLNLNGMTLEEAGLSIRDKLSKYIKEPTVNVRQLNHKFTVIGEVGRPGVFNLLDNHTTLIEVIGIAGELTVYGRRDNVMLMRTKDTKRELVKIDLTSREILSSPYYYIQNNDVIYVESRPGKITTTDRTVQLLPIILSITTTVLFLINLISK